MQLQLWEVPHDLRIRIASAIRDRKLPLIEDISAAAAELSGLRRDLWRDCAAVLLAQFVAALRAGELDPQAGTVQAIERCAPSLSTRHIVRAIHAAECAVLDALLVDRTMGQNSEAWPLIAHAMRSAAFEVAAVYAGREDEDAPPRDARHGLLPAHVFRLALEQEIARAARHEHGLSVLLFDVGSAGERDVDFGEDRLVERVGGLARRFFPADVWLARHGERGIIALLPETPLDDAASLAAGFCGLVSQRVALADFETGAEVRLVMSVAAAGASRVDEDYAAGYVIAAVETAVLRARLNGSDVVERVDLEDLRPHQQSDIANIEP